MEHLEKHFVLALQQLYENPDFEFSQIDQQGCVTTNGFSTLRKFKSILIPYRVYL